MCSARREVNWNYFTFFISTFRIKRKRKDEMSLSSCNSVNSAIMFNMEIMMKVSIAITLISKAIMVKAFKCPLKFKKRNFRKKSTKMLTICRIKLDVKNIMFRLLQLQS